MQDDPRVALWREPLLAGRSGFIEQQAVGRARGVGEGAHEAGITARSVTQVLCGLGCNVRAPYGLIVTILCIINTGESRAEAPSPAARVKPTVGRSG